jgi:predicted DNA-binding protein
MKNKQSKSICFRMPESLNHMLKKYATTIKISESRVIREALEKFLLLYEDMPAKRTWEIHKKVNRA